MTIAQTKALTTAQISQGLSTSQIAAITTADFAVLTTSQLAALTTTQVRQGLTADQLVALTVTQVKALTTAQVSQGLSTTQVGALELIDFASMSSAQIASLTTAQINQGLSQAQVASMSKEQLTGLSTAQIAAGLRDDQLDGMSSIQLKSLSVSQRMAFTTAQLDVLGDTKIAAMGGRTPIVLDLNGDGISTLSMDAGVQFDHDANGIKLHTGWVSSTDGLLVLDRNHDGSINDGAELFGSGTTLANGSKAADGYVALGELDINHDGLLSSTDAAYANLQVWVDANSDGLSTGGELKSLADLGISSISVVAERNISKDNGNIVGLTSSYQTTDGVSHAAADVWFATDAGTAPSPAAPSAAELSVRVSNLVQAIGQFDPAASPSSRPGNFGQSASDNMNTPAALVTASMGSLVDVLRQFDPDGNLVLNKLANSAAPDTKLKVPSLGEAVTGGLLASGSNK